MTRALHLAPRLLVAVLVVGCASPMTALRDDNRVLTQHVSELRDERRIQDRKLRDLQHQLDQARATMASSTIDGAPTLPVEVAGPPVAAAPPIPAMPDGQRLVGVADDGGAIIYEGDAAAGKSATLSTTTMTDDEPVVRRAAPVHAAPALDQSPPPTSSDRLEVTRHIPPVSSARAARTHVRDHDAPGDRNGDAAAEYRAAVELVKAGQHAEAIAALRAFLVKYPRHDYADNAQYWLGEAFYAQQDYTHALGEFRTVIEVYPRGNKVPDALLKVGYCYHAMGQGEKARAVLSQVVNLYPKSEPATLAAKRLEAP